MEAKIDAIKKWLGTGSVNIFGLPMAGKDTQGVMLAEALGAKFISSGMIIRAREAEIHHNYTDKGNLIPQDLFYEWVLPYFERPELANTALIMSSIGRWSGEEKEVLARAETAGHKIQAAVVFNISEVDVEKRFEASKATGDRGERKDDKNLTVFRNRLAEFRMKTLPVIKHYKELGLLVVVNGDQTREAVFAELIDKLYQKAISD